MQQVLFKEKYLRPARVNYFNLSCSLVVFNQFQVNVSFLYPCKYKKPLVFCCFQEYRNWTLPWDGLKIRTAQKVYVFEVFLVPIFHIPTECGDLRSSFPYLVQMPENMDLKNLEYVQFLRSDSQGNIYDLNDKIEWKSKLDCSKISIYYDFGHKENDDINIAFWLLHIEAKLVKVIFIDFSEENMGFYDHM